MRTHYYLIVYQIVAVGLEISMAKYFDFLVLGSDTSNMESQLCH